MDDFKGLAPKEYNWETNQISFNEPVVDLREGKPAILRFYTFKFNPAIKKRPSKQELFRASAKQITDMLWKDGLIERRDIAPRVSIGQNGYTVYVTAEARQGVMINDKIRSLNEVLSNK